ncbi:carnitine O-acetyltransferase-like isoform X2 [Paramacrobiotus metropolitanus]|uniref:carnitine O-acetyltransferase-like isoform X2 n=1 Tax=Paramacrobiotus metropolitanus TaxID=2943436 RepID=UPI002446104D|nr:carnitine O-acetyltransferase-like isoform X2 [Paramacrobiotus metropolitanus]
MTNYPVPGLPIPFEKFESQRTPQSANTGEAPWKSTVRCLLTRSSTEIAAARDTAGMPVKPFKHDHRKENPYPHALPPLPVPPLSQTLEKYYKSLKPFLSEGELRHTKKLLDEFAKPGGEGEALQQLLEQRAQKHENWLEDWWLHRTYLEYRPGLPVNVSPGIVFPCLHFSNQEGQLRTAAALITHILKFRELIYSGQLQPDAVKGQPVDMSQYLKIFGSYRIPGGTHDEIIIGEQEVEQPFIIVMHKNALFQIPIEDPSGRPFSHHELYLYLLSVVTKASSHPSVPVGMLTSQNRSVWSHAYKMLSKNKSNRFMLDQVQKSLFVVCLDLPVPNIKEHTLTSAGRQVLHGGGSQENSGNRWFDKTLQLIVGADGTCGWNYEHTLIEGPPLFRMMEYIVKQTGEGFHTNHHHVEKRQNFSKFAVPVDAKQLTFDLDKDMIAHIDTAVDLMDTHVEDVDLDVLDFTDYGKDFIKSRKYSPDSYFQMALQLAYYRLYNQIPPTYESASTRQFAHGRTETIRSASEESMKFVKAVVEGAGSKASKNLLTEAVNAHKKYGAEASKGAGVDRHLLGLKLTAVENGYNIPPFMMDVGYTTSTHWKLSTSQGNSDLKSYMCYGPAVADGFGCCYNPMHDRIIAGITATRSYPGTNAKRFMETVGDTFLDMKRLIE